MRDSLLFFGVSRGAIFEWLKSFFSAAAAAVVVAVLFFSWLQVYQNSEIED